MEKTNRSHRKVDIDPGQLRRELTVYQRSCLKRSSWQLVNTLVPYALLWYLAYRTYQYSFWLSLPILLLMAGFQVRAFIIFHDCGHRSFFRSQAANTFWGRLTAILTFTPFHRWRSAHARHHGTSGNLDKRGEGDVWMMTVDEYRQASRVRRWQYRLYRNPLVMFLLGPLFITLVSNRFVGPGAKRGEQLSVYATNVILAGYCAAMIWLVGWETFLVVQLGSLFLAHVAGVWLFYVQHQFEDVYWERTDAWNFVAASLEGGSFYELPAVLRWFTGNIGYHHVHHLNPRIPNYNLPRCYNRVPALQEIKPIKLLASLKSLKYRLWDEENARLVGFRAAARASRSVSP